MTAIETYGPALVGLLLLVLFVRAVAVQRQGPGGSVVRFRLSKLDLFVHGAFAVFIALGTHFAFNSPDVAFGIAGVLCLGFGIVRHRLRTGARYIWQWEEYPPTRNECLWMLYGLVLCFVGLIPRAI